MTTFSQVMDMMPFEELFDFLNHPRETDQATLFCMSAWMCPKLVAGTNIAAIMKEAGATDSLSAARRKIQENAVRWNGVKVTNPEMAVNFFAKGWGIIKVGKKTHWMVVNNSGLIVT